ncbi:MAG: Clp protease N-terminal domain-containing protein [Aggregatilineales bacterium]
MSLAQEAAERFQHSYIGTEHILLGPMREEGGIAGRVLRDVGVDEPHVEEFFERMTRAGQRTPNARPRLSPGTKKVIELAIDEARRMGHHYIGTEHLLLGMVRQNEGIAIDILKRLNVSPEEVRRQTRRVLQESPQATHRSPSAVAGGPPLQPHMSRQSQTKTPLLDQLAADLNALAEEKKLDSVVGRDDEIARIVEVLCRRENNGALLIGAPGVGKTAIIRGLVQRISDKTAVPWLHDKRVLFLDSSALIAGTVYRGQFEERLRRVIAEAQPENIILFIDQTHTLFGLGAQDIARGELGSQGTPESKHLTAAEILGEVAGEGMPDSKRLSAADIFKPALEDAVIRLIGAMTAEDYAQWERLDPVLARRFQIIRVNPPSTEDTIQIAHAVKPNYEAHHQVKITDEAISAAVRLSVRHLPERALPGKAISLIDEAASRVHLHHSQEAAPQVTASDIAEVVALWTGKSLTEISDTDRL